MALQAQLECLLAQTDVVKAQGRIVGGASQRVLDAIHLHVELVGVAGPSRSGDHTRTEGYAQPQGNEQSPAALSCEHGSLR